LFRYSIRIKSGSLSAKLVDSEGYMVMEFESKESRTKEIKINKTDTYKIVINGQEAEGSYNIGWEIK